MITKIVFAKIVFLAIAITTASAAAAIGATATMVVAYLADMPLGATIITAAPVSVAMFGITIALFAMAASLFFVNSESNAPDRKPNEN